MYVHAMGNRRTGEGFCCVRFTHIVAEIESHQKLKFEECETVCLVFSGGIPLVNSKVSRAVIIREQY